jgi:cellobiose phosphorylase
MYRLILESLLGLRLEAQTLIFKPCLPAAWTGFSLQYRWGAAVYAIEVQQLAGLVDTRVLLDGVLQDRPVLLLQDDAAPHTVVIQVPAQPTRER